MPPRRWTRVVAYALMGAAGLASLAWPSPSVERATSATSGITVYVWAGMLALGGISCAAGSATDRWLGEYAGLWPLIVTFSVYALVSASTGRATAIAGACALGSIALLLIARWRDVAHIRREVARYRAVAQYRAESGRR
jgi:hypothetical protein